MDTSRPADILGSQEQHKDDTQAYQAMHMSQITIEVGNFCKMQEHPTYSLCGYVLHRPLRLWADSCLKLPYQGQLLHSFPRQIASLCIFIFA